MTFRAILFRHTAHCAGGSEGSVQMQVRDLAALNAYVRLLGRSQRRLAAEAGVGHATLNHLLRGRRLHCSPETATAIERALRCPDGVFFAPSERPVEPAEPALLETHPLSR